MPTLTATRVSPQEIRTALAYAHDTLVSRQARDLDVSNIRAYIDSLLEQLA